MKDLRSRAHSKSFLYIFQWSFLSIALVCLAGCEDSVDGSLVQFSGTTMGTTYSVKIVDFPKAIDRQQLAAEIAHVLDKVNKSMSTYLQDSEIMRFNRASTTDWVRVSTDLLEVLEQSLYWNTRTGGAFDVTVGALVNLWGFGPEWTTAQIPPDWRIGRTADRDLASVTVVHSSAAAADALATALMVMGAEAAYKFAVREEIDASFLIRKGNDLRERFTPRFKSLLAKVE